MPAKSRSGRTARSQAQAQEQRESDAIAKVDASQSSQSSSSSATNPTTNKNAKRNAVGQQAQGRTRLLDKVITPGAQLTPEEALAATHWIRQIVAILLGLIFGALQLKGFAPVMTFCVVSFTTPFSLLSSFHELDLDEIATKGSLQYEGFFPATALYFLSWIIFYTIFLPASASASP